MTQSTENPANNPKGICITMFVLAGLAFLALSLFLLTFGLGWSNSQKEDHHIVFTVVAGWVYIAGSIFAFSRALPRQLLLPVALILNAIGAYVWLPSRSLAGGSGVMLLLGLMLIGVWIFFIVRSPHMISRSKHRSCRY
jgi:hypothetical protein